VVCQRPAGIAPNLAERRRTVARRPLASSVYPYSLPAGVVARVLAACDDVHDRLAFLANVVAVELGHALVAVLLPAPRELVGGPRPGEHAAVALDDVELAENSSRRPPVCETTR
jgi:hypothetical protein